MMELEIKSFSLFNKFYQYKSKIGKTPRNLLFIEKC